MKVTEVSDKPFDRLTRIGNRMILLMESDEESEPTDKAVIFLDSEEYSGIMVAGYEAMDEAIADIFVHLRAMFQASGKDLKLIVVPDQSEKYN
jgi:hypothetical protein